MLILAGGGLDDHIDDMVLQGDEAGGSDVVFLLVAVVKYANEGRQGHQMIPIETKVSCGSALGFS